MNFLRKRVLKAVALGLFSAAAIGGITAGIVVATTTSETQFDFIVSQTTPANTFNYLRDDQSAGPWTLTNCVEGLFNQYLSPINSPVHQLVGIAPISWQIHVKPGTSVVGDDSAPLGKYTIANVLAPGIATGVVASANAKGNLVVRFDLRTDAHWSNGDQVTANDFVDSVKYVLLPKNVSRSTAQTSVFQGFSKFKELIKDDVNLTLSDFDNNPKYNWFFSPPGSDTESDELGGIYSTIIRDENTNQISSQSITYVVNYGGYPDLGSVGTFATAASTYGLFFPSNRKFIESIGGFDAFGQDASTFVSNGAFYIKDAQLDFQVLYKANPFYWDRVRVLNRGYLKRVITDTITTQALFKTRKIGNTSVSPDQYRIFAADPDLKPFLSKGRTSAALTGWFYNLDNGPNKNYLRNIHFRRAIKYAIDRKSLLAALGYDDTVPTDLYAADISSHTDENGAHFRDFFVNRESKEISQSLTMNINGFIEKMIYFDYKTLNDLKYEELAARGFSNGDPQYNPELALKEFALFENDMKISGSTQGVYDVKAMLTSNSEEQTQVLMDQYLRLLFNGKIRISGFFVAASVAPQYQNSRDPSYDLVYTRWIYDTPDPFSYLRLWALTQDPADKGVKYNVAFDSYLVYTSPKGFADPNQFPMMDDMERTMGSPDESNFGQRMLDSFGVDWISYADWKATKERLLGWQSSHKAARIAERDRLVAQGKFTEASTYDISGVVNTESQILSNNDLSFAFSSSFKNYEGVIFPSLTISQSYRYQSILEAVLKNYAVASHLFQAALTGYASTLIGAYGSGAYFSFSDLSFKLSYVCSNPPKVQWSLPGCEAINGASLPIGGKS